MGKAISFILYFCRHETEYTCSLSDQTVQMVHAGYAYHRAFLRKTRVRIAGRVYPEECLFGCCRCFGDSFGLSGRCLGTAQMSDIGVYPFLLRISVLFVHLDIHGTGQTLVNGADSALLYDTTSQYKKENLYLRYEGRITMIGNFAEALAGIFGGLLAAYSLRLPFYAQAVIAFTGIPAAFALKEVNRSNKIQNPVDEIVRIIKYSLVTNKKLCYNIMFSGIIGAATLTMAWFVQPVLMYLETPVSWYGIIWTVLNLTVGFAALWSDRVDSYFGPRKMGILILAVIVGGYVALAFNLTYAGLAILLVFYIFRGFATPILKGYINQMTFSDMRATVLSIRNFIIRLMFAAIAPFIGWLNDMYSLQVALLVSAGIILLPGGVFLGLQYRKL